MISKTSMREGELCEPLLGENSPQPVAARSSFALCAGTAPEGVRRQALSVSRYLEITNNVLKRCGTAVVVGEISEIKRYSHLYFKVKDEGGTVDCLMFAFALKEVPFTPEVGMEVILVGESSLYAKNGSFKLLVKHMYLSGAGSLMAQIERLRRKLEEEGLFSGEKRPLPRFIRRVGLVTSREGAVLHDIRRTLWRRNPLIESVLFETLVQGAQAPAAIVAALDRAYAAEGIDVIVLARGGGSLEDLLPFFEESVVRKVAASPVPIISAIGHEPDVALTDYAADVRAATPTAAAELISTPTLTEIYALFEELERVLTDRVAGQLNLRGVELDSLTIRLSRRDPRLYLSSLSSSLSEREFALQRAVTGLIEEKKACLQEYDARLLKCDPRLYTVRLEERLGLLRTALHEGLSNVLSLRERRLSFLSESVKALSPEGQIARAESLRLNLEMRLVRALTLQIQKQSGQSHLLEVRLRSVPLKERLTRLEGRAETLVGKLIALNPLQILRRGYSVTFREGRSLKKGEAQVNDTLVTLVDGECLTSTVTEVRAVPAGEEISFLRELHKD